MNFVPARKIKFNKKGKKIQTIDGEGAYTGINPTPYTDYEKEQKEKVDEKLNREQIKEEK